MSTIYLYTPLQNKTLILPFYEIQIHYHSEFVELVPTHTVLYISVRLYLAQSQVV